MTSLLAIYLNKHINQHPALHAQHQVQDDRPNQQVSTDGSQRRVIINGDRLYAASAKGH